MKEWLVLGAAVAALASAVPAAAQEASGEQVEAAEVTAPAASGDTVATVSLPDTDEAIDVDAIEVPDLAFRPDPKYADDFDKYYYFHRGDTDFRTALADLRDCDGLSRGLASPFGYMETPYPYNMTTGGLIGGAIGNLMVAAIFGSAQVRATRRVNMRRCMFFKGYQRHGLPKDIWQSFNFEEGFSQLEEKKRQAFLKQQAKIASGPKPATEALGR